MSARIQGGLNIAMKVPPHQYQATVAFYRDAIGLTPIAGKEPAIGFRHGPNTLWIDEAPGLGQTEVWLELFTDDFAGAAERLAAAGVPRCDAVEALPEGFRGGWIVNPANVVHMLREPDAW